MADKNFMDYVMDQMRQGRSESQIARSLGMSLAHFMSKLNGTDAEKAAPPRVTAVKKPEQPKPEKKPKEPGPVEVEKEEPEE